MEREKKIVDASVIVKWFAKEEDFEKSVELRDKHLSKEIVLIVPELLFLEVMNALRYKEKNEEKIIEINKMLWGFQLNIQKINNNILEKAIKIAIKYNFTIYDSIYIALSQMYGCELITADEALSKIPNVKLLREI